MQPGTAVAPRTVARLFSSQSRIAPAPLHPEGCAHRGAQYSQAHHREYAVERLQKLALSLRALYLARPGLMTKILAIVAFFAIGVV